MSKVALVVSVLAETKDLAGGLADGSKQVSAFGKSIDLGMVAKATVATAAIAGVVEVIGGLTTAAIEDQAEQERLAQAIQASGAATGDWTGQVEAAIAAGQDKAFTDTEMRDALVPLVAATGDVGKATELMAQAQDVARLAGVDLATAAKAVGKAEEGSATQLAKLIGVSAKGKTATDVLTEAQRLAAGQAEKYGQTTKGQMESASIAFDEVGEEIGAIFVPILVELLTAVKPILKAFGELVKALLPILTPLIKLLGAAIGIAAKNFSLMVNVLVQVVKWISNAIKMVGDFLNSIKPLRDLGNVIGGIVGGLSRSVTVNASANVRGRGAGRAATSSSGAGGLVIVAPMGDHAVVRSLRRYTRTNGQAQLLPSW